jgi:hypothetical protein
MLTDARDKGIYSAPRASCWGIQEKPVTLKTSSLTRFVKWVFKMIKHCEDLESWTCEALNSRTCGDLESWTCEALKSWTSEDLESWTCEALKSRTYEDLESWTCEALKSRTWENLESWICEILKSRFCEIRESTEDQIQRLWCVRVSMNKRLVNQ